MTSKKDTDYIKNLLEQVIKELHNKINNPEEYNIEIEDNSLAYWNDKDDLLTILTKIIILKNKIIPIDNNENEDDEFEFNENKEKEILNRYINKLTNKNNKKN